MSLRSERRRSDRASLTATLLASLTFLTCLLPRPASAQADEWLSLGITAGLSDIRMVGYGFGDEQLTGLLYGVEGRATLWRLHVSGEYRQGRLDQEHLDGSSTRVWSARGRLGVHILPWVVLAAGPRVSTVGSPLGNRQIVRWRVEALGSFPLVPEQVSGYVELAGSVAGTEVGQVMPFEGGGGEIGIVLAPEGQSLWAKLGYRLDREFLSFGTSQTMETGYLSFGVAAPRMPGGLGGR